MARSERCRTQRPQLHAQTPEVRDAIVVVCNFTPVPRHGYRIGVPRRRILARGAQQRRRELYGGSGVGNFGERGDHSRAVARSTSIAQADAAATRRDLLEVRQLEFAGRLTARACHLRGPKTRTPLPCHIFWRL